MNRGRIGRQTLNQIPRNNNQLANKKSRTRENPRRNTTVSGIVSGEKKDSPEKRKPDQTPAPEDGGIPPLQPTVATNDQVSLVDSDTLIGGQGQRGFGCDSIGGVMGTSTTLQCMAAIQDHNVNRGMVLNMNDMRAQLHSLFNNELHFYMPYPDWIHVAKEGKDVVLSKIQSRLHLSNHTMKDKRREIEEKLTDLMRSKRTDGISRCKVSYLG